ncbi:MAG: DUF4156 domain-containing protein [Gammaproteobacteria bacterium]|nr:DUF4156 domain-containing protein [Gammaproteobacteria bacterium]
MLNRRTSSVLLVTALLVGCVFVQPTASSKKIRVLTAAEVDRCQSLGNLVSRVADRVGAIPRSKEAIADDVEINAKNSAADMGGDTIVPLSKIEGGRQTFGVYRCLS